MKADNSLRNWRHILDRNLRSVAKNTVKGSFAAAAAKLQPIRKNFWHV